MKRRIIAMLLALTLVMSLVPLTVTAEETPVVASPKAGTHTAAVHKCESCGTTEWLPWESSTTLPTSGHYYLTKDVAMTAPINDYAGTVHICLNGYVVKAASGKHHFNTRGVAEVVITDCTAYTDDKDVYHAGALTGGQDAVNGGGIAFVRRGGVVKIYDGRYTRNTAKAAGGAFCLQAEDKTLAGGKLYMFGGEISENQCINGTARKPGGGVWLNSGCLFEMTGGVIRDNIANSGGAVYGVGTPTINISNAKITGNNTSLSGAAIHDDSGSKITITDTEITGNTCTNATYGGIVFMGGSSGKLTLSGTVKITDNSVAGTGIADINMNKAATDTLYIQDLAAGSDVTFSTPATAATDPDEVMSAVSQTGWSVTWVKYKTASGAVKRVNYENGDFSFDAGHIHDGVEYLPLTSADQLIAGGNYYLADETVTLTMEANLNPGVTLNLCLNGHNLTSTSNTSGICTRLNATEETVINVYDCTAHTDSAGTYVAGKITGMHNKSNNNGGGAFMIRPKGVLNFYQGIISDCSATVGGGAIFINGTAHIYGGQFLNNQAVSGTAGKHGGAIFLNEQGTLTVENAKFVNNTTPYGNGGAIYAVGMLTVKNTEFTGSAAPKGAGGAISYIGKKTIVLEGCTFTGNKAQSASVINLGTSGLTATLKDVTITGNTNTSGFGAVNAVGGVGSLKLEGKVIIQDNNGNGKNDLHLQKGAVVVDASALENGSKITINLQDSRIEAEQMIFSTASENNKIGYFTSSDAAYVVELEQEQLILAPAVKHIHCLCGKTDCTDESHQQISYKAWTDPTSMPKSGNYYLTTDVIAENQTVLQNGQLNLCLHGHTVTVAENANRRRVYFVGSNTTLNIADCAGEGKVTGCTAGAIMTDSACKNVVVNLYGGTITENHATGTGASFVVQGQATLNMYGGTITANTAENGGGVTVFGKNAKFFLYGGTITANKANAKGGGLYVYEGTAELNAGTINNNEATHGGGFYVTGNTAYVNVQGTEITGNTASSGGGGIAESASVVNLSAGKIDRNKATASGAALYISTDCTVNMTGGTMADNTAANTAGAVYHLGSTGNYSGGTVSGNTAKNGGAITGTLRTRNGVQIPTMVTISGDVVFSGNTATTNGGTIYITGEGSTVKMQGGTVTGGKAKNAGGILAETKAVIEISGGKITGNSASANGGGIYASTNTKLTMTGGTVSGNTAKGEAGGIMTLRCTANFKGGSITGNTAGSGGGLKISGANATISSLTVSGNRAIGTLNTKTGKYTGGNAGGVLIGRAGYKKNNVQQWQYPSIYIYNIYLANNTANSSAGGMLVQSDGTVFRMSGGTVIGNTANNAAGGGGVYFSTNSRPVVTGGTFVDNTSGNGGAIYVLNTTADISNIVIKQNHSIGTGGGMTVTGLNTVVNVKNVQVFENTADGNAGGMLALNYSHLNLENVQIYDNTSAKVGGGLYYSQPGYGALKNVEIYNNHANEGGGLYVGINSLVTTEDLTVRDNTAQTQGGGIYNRGRLELNNSKVLNNSAKEGQGGGIFTFKTNSSLLCDDAGLFAVNTVISGNTATGQGGGVYGHAGCPIYLTNCTVTENNASLEGGGIYAGGRMGLESVTVTGNTSGGEGYAVYLPAAEYDGHSNYTGYKRMAGDTIIRENNGGEMYLGEETVLAITGEALGEKAYVDITIHAGVLSQWVHGVYGYEGGDQHYILTAGDRSITDPEPYGEAPEAKEQTQPAGNADIWLYAGIGVVAVAAIAGAVLVILKKKKSPAGETK